MGLISTSLSYIFDALFGDTPLGHIFFRICPYAHMPKYAHMPIWAYGHAKKNMAKWGIPEKSIKNVAQGC